MGDSSGDRFTKDSQKEHPDATKDDANGAFNRLWREAQADSPDPAAPKRSSANDNMSRQPADSGAVQTLPDVVITGSDKITAGSGADPVSERARLEVSVDKNITDSTARARFMKDIDDFEKRAAAAKPPLSPEEVAKTYTEIALLVEAKDSVGTALTRDDRLKVAEQVMHHCADPSSVDQGKHGTCNVASLENRLYSRNPSAAAALVTEVAVTGQYTTRGESATTVFVDYENLLPDPEAALDGPHQDGKRDFASQLFQVTAVNIGHEKNPVRVTDADGNISKEYKAGEVEYVQGTPDPGVNPPTTGEVLVDKVTREPILDADGNPIDYPYLKDDHVVDISNEITGNTPPEKGVLLANSNYVAGDGKLVTKFEGEHGLKEELEKAQKEGRLPVILKVSTGQQPFFTDSGGNSAGGAGGAHVVTVTGYDASTGEVTIDNQWGKDSDHKVKIHDLYLCTLQPKVGLRVLQEECALNAEKGQIDYVKELTLLRLKRHIDGMSTSEYDSQLAWLTKQAVKEAKDKHGGVIDQQLRTELVTQFNEVHKENPKRSEWLKNQVWETTLVGIQNGSVKDVNYYPDYATRDMERDVQKIFDAYDPIDDDEDDVYDALRGKTPAQMHQMEELFKQKHGVSLDEYLQKFLNESELDKARGLITEAKRAYCPKD